MRLHSLHARRHKRSRALGAIAATALTLSTGAIGLAAQPAVAAADEAAPGSVALVGSLQDELGCGADWDPACDVTELTDADGDGTWEYTATVPAGSYEVKVALNDTWDTSYGKDGGGDNIPLTLAGDAELTFTWNQDSHRIGLASADLDGAYTDADAALAAAPVRQGTGEQFYFVLTDRFANGDTSNDAGGLTGGSDITGLDPTDKGYYHGGDIQGLIDHLDYIQDLGTTAIWLTPSFTNQAVQGTGENASAGYHGYWITDFTSIDPHLGGNEALAQLRDALHARGMKLYLDIITNHTADLISYEEGTYTYVETADVPYTDAAGNVIDISALAGRDDFPTLDAATSFPYTPVRNGDVIPEALNDVTLYHNRGDSTWTGESTTMGDFQGLDDLMTENPIVEQTFEEIYTAWMDFGVDGFRIDTVKHVNYEFWQAWTAAIDAHAEATNPDFFTFGEVYDADATKTSPYVRGTGMDATLDFAFQAAAQGFAKGRPTTNLGTFFATDDYYTTTHSSVYAEPTFLGNHDMGRIGYLLGGGSGSEELLARSELAHSLMLLTRGQPVIYYGDEQGLAGSGGDKDARQDMFATQVDQYAGEQLIDGTVAGSTDRYNTDSALYQHIAELSRLRATYPALSTGSQIELYSQDSAGVYAFARVDRDEKVEHLVALNNAGEEQTVTLTSLTPGAAYTPLYGTDKAVTADADGKVTLTVPALGAVVLRADATVAAAADQAVTFTTPNGANLSGSTAEIAATTAADRWAETTFSYRPLGTDEWTAVGTAEDDTPRVYADLSNLSAGTVLEVRAVTTDADGNRAAASILAVVGADLSGAQPQADPEAPIDGLEVTIPGDHNTEMGCISDWQPDCEQALLTQDSASGLYTGTFDIPAGTWQYKVAIGGTWDENYGADAVAGGDNIYYTTAGGPVTFFYDARTHQVWNDAEAPVVTLPGSFQDELGCASDWDPACLASIMRPAGEGKWTFSTAALPTGAYEVKVAVGRSWDENYGVDGVAGGANYSFPATAGKSVVFTYDESTHLLTIEVTDPPAAGTGEERAYWIDSTTLAWPVSLLPDGVTRAQVVGDDGTAVADAPISLGLVLAPEGGAALSDGKVTGGAETPLRVVGNLPDDVLAAHPNLDGYIAVSLTDADGSALLSAEEVAEALKGQVAVVQRSSGDAVGSGVTAFTGVQTAPVIDALYADAVAEAPLGVTFTDGVPEFALWAPTAQAVTLLTWDTGSATGSAALVDGDPVRTPAVRGDDGRWTVDNADGGIPAGCQYQWEVQVYAPSTGKVETNLVTDPYSVGLTLNSARSVAVDLSDPDLAPEQWASTASPQVDSDAGRTIYELHARDFSAADQTVPEAYRGTYKAFTVTDSDGMRHLAELADAGIDTVHLLPTFDIASIEEDRSAQQVPDIPADAGPDSTEQQAAVSAVKDADAYNWGYDPYHYTTPEGSYATEGNQDGGARTVEFREMVGALHATGLQVVLDQVFNHTAGACQDATSVLDRVVPGYYQRLDAKGDVLTSTCCPNTATENALMERLMIDSVVTWARDYHVDGFRFDLMGYHSVDTMKKLRAALDELTLERDGVDGSAIYLYGEGWNMGEIADNALFTTATQGQLDGTGIGTFNDRLRDAVHGGGPFDDDPRIYQGFGTGLYTDPNGLSDSTEEQQLADLGHLTDLVKLGLAGNLKDYSFTQSDGTVKRGAEIDYNGQAAGYASSPEETINYVDAHDNETLFDLGVFKLATDTPMADRVRMNSLSLATVTLGQSPSFWAAGTEMLRSKSLDRDSYNSGDHFNAIDWTGQDNGFGAGLPVESSNGSKWDIMRPLLADASLKPTADDIATSNAQMLDMLRIRTSTPLFRLGSADAIQAKLSFPNSGTEATPGVIDMFIDDTLGDDADASLAGVLVVFNASDAPVSETITDLAGREFVLHQVQADGADEVVKASTFDTATGTATVPARTVAVYVEKQAGGTAEPTAEPTVEPTAEPTSAASAEPTAEPTATAASASTQGGAAPSASQGATEVAASATAAPGKTGTGPLARTGAEAVVPLIAMAVALIVAGVLLGRRRRA